MLKKRTALRLLVPINLLGAYVWHMEGLGIGASIISCAVAGIFLYASFHRRKLRVPGPNATPKEKAEYNLLRVAKLVGAEEVTDGWELKSGGQVFRITNGHISCVGRGQTCYFTPDMPNAEVQATALLWLSKYPQAWEFWAARHGQPWHPSIAY